MKKQLLLSGLLGILTTLFLAGQPLVVKKYTSPLSIDPLEIDKRDFRLINTVELVQKADGLFSAGDYQKAAMYYLLVVNNNCTDCYSYYNLSRCYAMMEDGELASHFLFLALETGYSDFNTIRNEEAFRKIRRDPLFRDTMEEVSERAERYGEIIWVEQKRFDRVRIFYPPGYDPSESYPLLIALHGRGDNALNFSDIWKDISDRGIILALPEGPYSYGSSGPAGSDSHSWDIITSDEELMKRADPEVMAYVAAISDELKERLKIGKTILLGFSQGAAYAYATGLKYHDRFDGLICFGGRFPDIERYPWFLSADEINRASGMPVFIGHGLNDSAVSYKNAERSSEILLGNGYRVKLSLYEGGHFFTVLILDEALDWLVPE
jgi:phospholipase/carboxylesterase